MRIRAEVSMFSKEAATRAPSQNMLRAILNSYSNFTAGGIILEGCARQWRLPYMFIEHLSGA